jgi:hypothetical protein
MNCDVLDCDNDTEVDGVDMPIHGRTYRLCVEHTEGEWFYRVLDDGTLLAARPPY